MSTKPKKAPTKATYVRHYPEGLNRHPRVKGPLTYKPKRDSLPRRTSRHLRSALDVAIERGERLAKIAEICERGLVSKAHIVSVLRTDMVQILKLAKGA